MKAPHLASVLLLVAVAASGQQHHPDSHLDSPEQLGSVHFPTSCSTAAQPQFDRAVALMHSFQFARAIQEFNSILAADPSCSMAWWGIALSNWGNPFAAGLKPQTQLDLGQRAINQALDQASAPTPKIAPKTGPKTERERAWIEAVAHLYTNTATVNQHARMVAYEQAMAALSAAYPDDTEAAIFYALSLAAAADPADKTYADQLKAGAILEKLFVQYPNHPGLAHYIIHTYDVPALADRAVNAAERYGTIAPATPHALHMPSHTFTRIGNWQASIDTNIASAASAHRADQPPDELHASDYLVYAYLQTGQDSAAQRTMQSAAEIFSRFDPKITIIGAGGPSAAYFARAAIPARYCLERGAWSDAAKLEAVPSSYPYTDAITYFARGLGAAHVSDQPTAQAAITSLTEMHDKLTHSGENYWAFQVEIQRQEVAAWLAFALGNKEAALTGMRAAAEMEDKTEKNAVTPGPLAPARELLGELLLESNRPAEALKEFEATLVKEPNRFRSLYGAAEAAKTTGDQKTAQAHFEQLQKIIAHADQPGRPELAEIRKATQQK